jgi:hypothetical protein
VDGITLSPLPLQNPLEVWLGGLATPALLRCGRLGDGWLGAVCTPVQAAAARATIDAAAESADRTIDPEHFGLSIAYSHGPLGAEQLAVLTARNPDADPRTLVPDGFPALRRLLESHIAAGMSKFVIRPPTLDDPAGWHDELEALAHAVNDLQT